jgi:hypothetical protein
VDELAYLSSRHCAIPHQSGGAVNQEGNMRTPASMAFVFALAVLDATRGYAQLPVLVDGTRVRVVTQSLPADHQLGRIISADHDTVAFRPDADPFTVSLAVSEIERIDISQGSHRHPGRGALVGLTIGAIGGAVFGASAYTPCTDWCLLPNSRAATAGLGAAFFGLLGAAGGGIVGALIKAEEWKPLVVRPTSGLTPAGQRTFGIQVSRTF